MFVRVKKNPKTSKRSVQIVESYRVDGKVRQRILQHIGMAQSDQELEELKSLADSVKRCLEEERTLPLYGESSQPESLEEASRSESPPKSKPHNEKDESSSAYDVNLLDVVEEARHITGIHDIYGKLYDELGFGKVIPNPARNKAAMEALREIVLARIANPQSKRSSVEELQRHFGIDLPIKRVYTMMDKLNEKAIERINTIAWNATRSILAQKIDVIYFDATTLYFESFEEDELRKNGYSKDGKFNQPQVVLALMVTKEGLPVGYRLFEGDTFDGHTLLPTLKGIRAHYDLDQVIYVADAGMFNKKNREELETLEKNGTRYIVGARIKNLPDSLKAKILDPGNYRSINEDLEVATFEYEGKRLVVSRSAKRARKDAHDRQKGIEKLRKRLEKEGTLKGQLSNQGYRKYLRISSEGECDLQFDEAKIEEESRWDGLKGILSNDTTLGEEEIIHQYGNLWQIEESFRITKHDLKIRPIYHFKPERVKAHIALTFMAYTLVRHLSYRVKLQYKAMSPEAIRQQLMDVQRSILLDTRTQRRFSLPSSLPLDAEKIYRVMGLKPPTKAKLL